jgi:hypothetical protein
MKDGKVTLVAKDVTVKQILTEWARIGQTKIVNLEKIPGGPLTLELVDVPEAQALDVLLRSVAGYMAAPRSGGLANLSSFDRIVVMPASAAPRSATAAATPAFQQPQFAQPPMPADDDDDPRPPAPVAVPGRGPIFNTVPQPQVVNPIVGANGQPYVPSAQGQQTPPAQRPPTSYPGAPSAPYGGVAVPGMVVPVPPPPPPQTPAERTVRPNGRGGR